ncbi:hypothetical protein KCU61_g8750, partial [Aureobasidium melanogenum]
MPRFYSRIFNISQLRLDLLAFHRRINIRLVVLTRTAHPTPPIPNHTPNRRTLPAHMHNLTLYRHFLTHPQSSHILDIQNPTHTPQHPETRSRDSS